MDSITCILCLAENPSPIASQGQPDRYFHCMTCDLRFLNPSLRLPPDEEKARYLSHNNDVSDVRYQKFVEPLYLEIRNRAPENSQGLDFGAGTGPVLAHKLNQAGFRVSLYDPYFWPDKQALEHAYDFIVACEVIEHLYAPRVEFERLRDLLKPGGTLALMTTFYDDGIDFETWYYRRDPTHVAFYSNSTFHWIQRTLGFKTVELLNQRIAVLTN